MRSFKTFMETTRPTVFYRGTNPGDTRRIRTGDEFWDSLLFVSDNPTSANAYGESIEKIVAKIGAKILYEGSKPFRSVAKGLTGQMSMLDYCSIVAKRAAWQGYDAVWFKRQTDIGTAIINKNMFERQVV